MTIEELKRLLAEFVAGDEEEVDKAPIIPVEELMRRLLKAADNPDDHDLWAQTLYSLAKGLKVGAYMLTYLQ